MHGGVVACDICEIKCTSRKDLSKHSLYKHGLHHGARYFSKSRKDTKKDDLYDAEKTKTNDKTSNDIDDLEEAKSTEQQLTYFECKKTCSSIQKTFSSEDAFQLHESYFHSEDSTAPNQTT